MEDDWIKNKENEEKEDNQNGMEEWTEEEDEIVEEKMAMENHKKEIHRNTQKYIGRTDTEALGDT